MKRYEFIITKKVEQLVSVEGDTKEEALDTALEECEDVDIPNLWDIQMTDYKVIKEEEENEAEEIDEDE